jgi:hypothetical protein
LPGAAFATTYYIYYTLVDPNSSAGSYSYSTNINDALGPSKVYIGFWTTRASSGATGGGGFQGGDNCVLAEAFVPTLHGVKKAKRVTISDQLSLLDEVSMEETLWGPVEKNYLAPSACVLLETESGIQLTCSVTTPVYFRDGTSTRAPHCLGKKLPVRDRDGFRWEQVVKVEDAGVQLVAHISCYQHIYAAGDDPERFIYTHNPIGGYTAKP